MCIRDRINSDNPLPIDFCFDYGEFNIGMISDVTSLENCYGTGIKEPLFVINLSLIHIYMISPLYCLNMMVI